MRALVTGCTGYIGSHLIKQLIEDKYDIRILIRDDTERNIYENLGIEVRIGDITKKSTLVGIEKDVDLVFHFASIFLGSEYRKTVVDGTQNLINIFRKSDLKSFVFTSFSPVYGSNKSDIYYTEEMTCKPNFSEAKLKLEAEKLLLKAYHEFKLPIIILRLPSVYGGNNSHFENIFIKRIQNKKLIIFGSGQNKNSYVHIDDVMQAIMLSISKKEAIGEVFNVSGGDAISMNELCTFIADILRVRKPNHMPVWFAKFLSTIITLIMLLTGKSSPFSISLIKLLTMNGALNIEKINRILGFKPIYPITLRGIEISYFENKN